MFSARDVLGIEDDMSETFHRAALLEDMSEGRGSVLQIGQWPVFLCLSDGEPRAVVNRCTHMGTALTGGRVRRGSVICPDHGAIFNLSTGACVGGVGYPPLRVLATRLVDGWVEVAIPETAAPTS